jgi:hypothetical protein
MLLGSFSDFILQSIGGMGIALSLCFLLALKSLAKNSEVKKAAGAKVLGMIVKWMR